MSLAIVEVLATLDPPHGAAKQYQGIANTFVQLFRFRTSGVIASKCSG